MAMLCTETLSFPEAIIIELRYESQRNIREENADYERKRATKKKTSVSKKKRATEEF